VGGVFLLHRALHHADRFEATIMESSLFMAVMGIGFCLSFAWQ
jgi:hypothetical protein